MTNREEQVTEALDLMHEARKILFQILHEKQEVSRSLADGVDKLALAFEFVENPDGLVFMCPSCECFFYETLREGHYRCLSCDREWAPQPKDGRYDRH